MLVPVLVDRYQRVYSQKLYLKDEIIDFDQYSDDDNNDNGMNYSNRRRSTRHFHCQFMGNLSILTNDLIWTRTDFFIITQINHSKKHLQRNYITWKESNCILLRSPWRKKFVREIYSKTTHRFISSCSLDKNLPSDAKSVSTIDDGGGVIVTTADADDCFVWIVSLNLFADVGWIFDLTCWNPELFVLSFFIGGCCTSSSSWSDWEKIRKVSFGLFDECL